MEINGVVYAIIAFFFFVISYFFLIKSRTTVASTFGKYPPEARGAWPFIGHLRLLAKGEPGAVLGSLADKYGPIFTIRIGFRRAVIVSGYEFVKELFTVHDLNISARPDLRSFKHMSYDYAMFGLGPYGPYFKKMRKFIKTELFSTQRIETLSRNRLIEIGESINELHQVCGTNKTAVVDLKKWIGDLSFKVSFRIATGKKYDEKESENRKFRDLMKEFHHFLKMFLPADAWPFLGWFDLGGHEKRMKKTANELDEIFSRWTVEAVKFRRSEECAGENSFLDVLSSAVLPSDKDSDSIIKATTMSLLLAGDQSGSTVLGVLVSILLSNQEVMKKAQEELDDKIRGKIRLINDSDINDLVYLRAIIKETFRLHASSLSLEGARAFRGDCIVQGYHVKKGTWLFINMGKLHKDPRFWSDDASEFKPERFLEEHKNVDLKGNNYEFIPFGAGRKICPGLNVGMQMLQLALANLLYAFDLKRSDEGPPHGEGITKPNLSEIILVPRLPRPWVGI